jgi:hypothetical protein
VYVVLKKKYKKYKVVTLKGIWCRFFLFERQKKTKASFRKSLKCPGREAQIRVRAHAQQKVRVCGRRFLAMYRQQGAAADHTYFLWFF